VTAADARTIAPYLPEDAVVEPLSDERSRVTLGSWSWPGLAGAFAGFAVDFVVEGPEDLRDAVGALATRLRAASAR